MKCPKCNYEFEADDEDASRVIPMPNGKVKMALPDGPMCQWP